MKYRYIEKQEKDTRESVSLKVLKATVTFTHLAIETNFLI